MLEDKKKTLTCEEYKEKKRYVYLNKFNQHKVETATDIGLLKKKLSSLEALVYTVILFSLIAVIISFL